MELCGEDPFALMGVGRRPMPDPEEIRSAYFRLAARWHPDKPGGDAGMFARLARANEVLTSPAKRLRFLAGDARGGTPSPELFSEVGGAITASRSAEKALGASPSGLAASLALAGAIRARGALIAARDKIDAEIGRNEDRVREADRRWPGTPPALLAEISSERAFLERWSGQIRERIFEIERISPQEICAGG